MPPVTTEGTDPDSSDRFDMDERLKTVKAQVISHFHGQVVYTALSLLHWKERKRSCAVHV